MIRTGTMKSGIEMQLNSYNLSLSGDLKAEFRRAKTPGDVRICLNKGAKAIAKQMCGMYGIRIVKPVGEIIKTGLQGEGMAAEAVETATAVTEVTETAAVVGDGVTLTAEATELLAVAESGEVAVAGSGFNPAVIVIVIVVIAVAYYYLRGQVQTSNQRFWLDEEFRKIHKSLVSKLKNG